MWDEAPASGLDGLRDAGSPSYQLLEEADQLRTAPGFDPWQAPRTTQLFLVCAWNAFALQATADHVLDAADPAAHGTVPLAVLAYAQSCFAPVTAWIRGARFAQVNPSYRISTALPAAMPPWPLFERARRAHVRALRAAYEAVAPRAEYDLRRLVETVTPAAQGQLAELNLVQTEVRTAFAYAEGLDARARGPAQLREVSQAIARALGSAFTLGQLVAMPSLVARLHIEGYRVDSSEAISVPLTTITVGCPVVDRNDDIIGRVVRLEGETKLGSVSGLVVSTGAFSPNRRVRVDQLRAVAPGIVRLSVLEDDLEAV
jgi:hypothetical protein